MLNISRHALFLGVAGFVLLSSCGTPEYRTEKSHCEAEWLLKIPPVYRQEIVTKYRNEEQLTGETICETTGSTTKCKPIKKTVSVPYTAVETVDIKRAQRDPQIASCTARACVARYGNTACEM